MAAPLAYNEPERLASLRSLDILDTAEEDMYDQIRDSATQVCETPIALLSLIDDHRQWFKAHCGLSVRETTRDISFCAYAILQSGPFIIENAEDDERFRDNPLVTGPEHIRFYAGFPIYSEGQPLGTLCVLDRAPRHLEGHQIATMLKLAGSVTRLLRLRARQQDAIFATAVSFSNDAIAVADAEEGGPSILYVNRSFLTFCGCKYHEAIGQPVHYPCPIAITPRDGQPVSLNCDYSTGTQRKYGNVTIVPYVDQKHQAVYYVAIHQDLTHLKREEAQRNRLHGMVTALRSVDHVVRNFLNTATVFRHQVENWADTGTLMEFDLAIASTKARLSELTGMREFRERQTPFGFTMLDPEE